MALGLDDVAVGTWTSPAGPSGCTVVLPPPGTVGSIAVRGRSPGTREALALAPDTAVQQVDAVVLAGGSAFGLAAADGVMAALEARGRGVPVRGGRVPIVASAIVLDEGATDPGVRPDAAAGRAAVAAATTGPVPVGRVGAGAGATVAKVAGWPHHAPGGQGVAIERDGDLVVGALVVNNAVGEVVGPDGAVLVATGAPELTRWPADPAAMWRGMADPPEGAVGDAAADVAGDGVGDVAGVGDGDVAGGAATGRSNTVVGCVVTNAVLTKAEAHRVADLAHDGLVLAVRPAHTSLDGDALFALATGEVEVLLDRVVELAVAAVAAAARAGPVAAVAAAGRPAAAAEDT